MKYVGYLRVSTTRQGQSGLGLEAQREAVAMHVNGQGTLAAEYVEIESGKA
jgi:DNA invertase Pin-like site-specific DNA recombinase